jgi:hypothetical protein
MLRFPLCRADAAARGEICKILSSQSLFVDIDALYPDAIKIYAK